MSSLSRFQSYIYTLSDTTDVDVSNLEQRSNNLKLIPARYEGQQIRGTEE